MLRHTVVVGEGRPCRPVRGKVGGTGVFGVVVCLTVQYGIVHIQYMSILYCTVHHSTI